MAITAIEVENFRGIRRGSLQNLTSVNVLVGANNSGKSTLVEALVRVAKHNSGDDSAVGQENSRAGRARNEPHELDASALFRGAPSGRATVSLDEFLIQELVLKRVNAETEALAIERKGTSPATQFGALKRLTCLRPPDVLDGSIAPKLWPQLLRDRSDKRLASALQKVYGGALEGAQLAPSGHVHLLYPDHTVLLDAHGEGMRVAFRILLVLARLEDTMLCVEEPECFQHPRALDKLALAMCTQAKAQSVQLLFTTHSLGCVRAFHHASAEAGLDFAVHHLDLDTDGVLDVRRIDGATFEALDESGTDVRRLDEYA